MKDKFYVYETKLKKKVAPVVHFTTYIPKFMNKNWRT